MRLTRLKRAATGGAALALAAGVSAVIGLSAPAGAVNNDPVGNPTSPLVTYELDCPGQTGSLADGQTAPFIVGTAIDTTTDTGHPTGTTFGIAGAVSTVLSGAVVAPLNAALNPATVQLQSTVTFGSTDGTATGTWSYSGPTITVANPGGAIAGATWNISSPNTITLAAAPPAGLAVGDLVAASPTGTPPPGFPPATSPTVVTAIGPGNQFTINNAVTATNSTAATLGFAPSTGITFTDPAVASPTNAFTTNGSEGGKASIGVIGSSGITMTVPPGISLPFGTGTPAFCGMSGYFAGTPENSPLFPPGTTTPMVNATQFESGAFVNLAATPPTPTNQTVNLGEGGSGSVTLTATAGTYPVDPNGFTLVSTSPQGSLSFSLGAGGLVSLSNTASSPEIDHILFNACDTLPAGNGGPVCSTTPGDITVNIGTPPVTQPLSEQVNAGALVLSCNSPSNYVTGNNTPTPVGNPALTCPEFQFQPITLDGLEQQVTATTGNTSGNPSGASPGTIYISDNRGDPTDQWTLTASFIATSSGVGGVNPNASCAGIVAFCNSSVGVAALNMASNGAHDGQIAPNYLQVSGIGCLADATGGSTGPDGTLYNPPNLNPNATPTAGGNFGSTVTLCSASQGQSGGTFLFNATYTLTIPESVYAGNYFGSVQYLVS